MSATSPSPTRSRTSSASFDAALAAFEEATRDYLQNVEQDPDRGSAVGVDYLMLAGVVTGGWMMARSALAARRHIDAGDADDFYALKLKTAVFYGERVLPRSQALAQMVRAGSASTMAVGADEF